MSKAPSVETQLKSSRRAYREAQKQVGDLQQAVREYRTRATKAEQECADWKRRFDELLFRREPAKDAPHA
jgi:soluble cytochrome b562